MESAGEITSTASEMRGNSRLNCPSAREQSELDPSVGDGDGVVVVVKGAADAAALRPNVEKGEGTEKPWKSLRKGG